MVLLFWNYYMYKYTHLTISNYINVFRNQGFHCKRRGTDIKSWKLSKILSSLMGIGNSSIKTLLYSVSNCITVIRSNCSPARGLLPWVRPSFQAPTEPPVPHWPRHSSLKWKLPGGYSLGGCGWRGVSRVSVAPKSVRRCALGPPGFPVKSPSVGVSCCSCVWATVAGGTQEAWGLRELLVRQSDWKPSSPRPGNALGWALCARTGFGNRMVILSWPRNRPLLFSFLPPFQLLKSFRRPGLAVAPRLWMWCWVSICPIRCLIQDLKALADMHLKGRLNCGCLASTRFCIGSQPARLPGHLCPSLCEAAASRPLLTGSAWCGSFCVSNWTPCP